MALITNNSDRLLYRRLPRGGKITWQPGQTVEVESERLLAQLETQRVFSRSEAIGPAGHLPEPKVGRRSRRPAIPEEREKIGEARPRRKPKAPSKGLKKKTNDHPGMICGKAHPGMKHADWMADKKGKKGIGIDLDGDGKVDVVVGGD